MIQRWKLTLTTATITAMLLCISVPVLADEAPSESTSVIAVSNNNLTATIQTAIKGVSVDSNPNGSNRIAATVRLYNNGSGKVRVPDYELRAQTKEGLQYRLVASSENVKTLEPKEVAELVYVSEFDSKTSPHVSGLSFVKVDEFSYPKIETDLLYIPLGSEVWYGTDSASSSLNTLPWNQTFTIPGINSQLRYTPVGYSMQHTDKGVTALITLLAENPEIGSATIPDFRIDTLVGKKKYTGKRTEEARIELAVGEKKFIHFAISMENGSIPTNLLVMTTENFSSANATVKTAIDMGRLAIAIPSAEQANVTMGSYSIGNPIAIDPLYGIVDHTEISLMEMHMQQNPGESSKTAIAKFLFVNKNSKPIPIPIFETELTSNSGATYSGNRQTNAAATLNPGLGYIVSYSFNLPVSEDSSGLVLTLLDTKTAASYKIAAASVLAPVQKATEGNTLVLYPFDVEITDYSVGTNYVASNLAYSYKLKISLDIKKKDNIEINSDFSKLRFEVVDTLGRVLATADQVLTGDKKLVTGTQTIVTSDIKSEQFEFPIKTNVYELIDTTNGQAKRLIKTLN